MSWGTNEDWNLNNKEELKDVVFKLNRAVQETQSVREELSDIQLIVGCVEAAHKDENDKLLNELEVAQNTIKYLRTKNQNFKRIINNLKSVMATTKGLNVNSSDDDQDAIIVEGDTVRAPGSAH